MRNENHNIMNKLFKVTRKDGTEQYFKKSVGSKEYFPIGGGFGIVSFDAISVEEVEEVPTNFVKGFAHFDSVDSKEKFKAIEDSNSNWNGWSMPYIHVSDVKKLCDLISWDEEKYTYNKRTNKVVFTSTESDDYTQEIEPSIFDGEIYFNFGFFGLCFQFKKDKK